MTCTIDPPGEGPANMARDLAMLEAAVPSSRVYTWSGVWVSLGRFQAPLQDLVPGNQTPWVRRQTGGRAVLHGHDWTVALVLPLSGARSVRAVYRRLVAPLVEALRCCDLRAALGEDTSYVAKGTKGLADCFATTSPNDVVDSRGRKVCGCALRVTREAALLQASIPKTAPLLDPATVIRGAQPAPLADWDVERFPSAWLEIASSGVGMRLDV